MDAAKGVKGQGRPLYAGPWSGDGAREVSRSETRMSGCPSFWLLFLGQARKSDAPEGAQPKRKLTATIGLTLSLLFLTTHAHAFDLDQLSAQLAKPAVVRGPFVQEKHLRALPTPLTSQGQFTLSRDHGLLWLLQKPLKQDYRIADSGIARRTAAGWQQQPGQNVAAQQSRLFLAVLKGEVEGADDVLVRMHSECLTGDVFGSLRCDCGEQLELALHRIAAEGRGAVIYLRQEGRGIGLGNKIRAYALQDGGQDTVQANESLGFKPDLRDYGIGAQILLDLGLHRIRLLTNNPRKVVGLDGYDLEIVGREPLRVEPGDHNRDYLETKRTRLGHLL